MISWTDGNAIRFATYYQQEAACFAVLASVFREEGRAWAASFMQRQAALYSARARVYLGVETGKVG